MSATWEIREGDCVEAMAAMAESSVDAIVCDPPYGLEFMGKDWDRLSGQPGYNERGRITDRPDAQVPYGRGGGVNSYQAGRPMQVWHEAWAREALRVLKPGGHLLAFGGTRTYHRLACAVEDAGFEVRDCIAWMYGSGFPKSLDVSKAIDKAAGAEREVVEQGAPFGRGSMRNRSRVEMGYRPTELNPDGGAAEITAPATPEAERWDGWGTALKPAFEPIVVARKPLVGTVAANVLAHGTGALNIDGCRIEGIAEAPGSTPPSSVDGRRGSMAGPMDRVEYDPTRGRWPANVALDPDAAAILDEQAGELTNCGGPKSTTHDGGMFGIGTPGTIYADQGGASRFFYCAKTSREERNAGLDAFAEQQVSYMNTHGGNADKGETWSPVDERTGHERDRFASRTRNPHPTVKPIELMRWLVRLVTPPGGLVFDPFVGSGTTGCAAVLEGFRFIGVECEALYVPIARARIGWWAAQPPGISLVDALEGAAVRRKVADTGQTSIFDTEAA